MRALLRHLGHTDRSLTRGNAKGNQTQFTDNENYNMSNALSYNISYRTPLLQPVFQCAHALHCCATHGPGVEDLKGDSSRIKKKARHKKLQQNLKDWSVAEFCCQFHQLRALMDEDVFGDLLWDEPTH